MSDESDHPAPPQAGPPGSLRSPIRPAPHPDLFPPSHERPALSSQPAPPTSTPSPDPDPAPDDPQEALILLRQKTETAVDEYAKGLINRVQFYAIYQRYNEQRAIIEKLVQRDPDGDAWRQVVSNRGHTGFLRARLEAQPMSYSIHAAEQLAPLLTGGTPPVRSYFPTESALKAVWAMPNRPVIGLGRKPLKDEHWLVMAVGERAATLVLYSLEPSKTQARLLRDLHLDFERANKLALERGWLAPERIVFPQRALFEDDL
ncbi:MAG: hypothetical protein U0452_07395 [Anaerolineae bacterium]